MLLKKLSSAITCLVIITLLVTVLLGNSTVSGIKAQDEEQVQKQSQHNIDAEVSVEREIKVESDDSSFTLESTLKNAMNLETDVFEIGFKLQNGLELILKYKQFASDSENLLTLGVEIEELVEFLDTDQTTIGGYDEEEDIVTTIKLSETNFQPLLVVQQQEGDLTRYILTAETMDGLFLIRFYFASDFDEIAGRTVYPTELKFDIEIHNFPFATENSYFALPIKLKTELEAHSVEETLDERAGYTENERGIEFKALADQKITAFFSWQEYLSLDGQLVRIVSTNLRQDPEGNQIVSFSVPQGQDYVWDPVLGVNLGEVIAEFIQLLSNTEFIIITVISSGLGLVIFIRIRPRR